MTEATEGPDNTAVRVALWRALHVEIDAPPYVFDDEIGVRLAAPDAGWRGRGDMHPAGTSIRVFEIDQPDTQAWKHRRLVELGFGIPDWLRLVPVDFGADESWWEQIAAAGFDATQPAIVASAGVTMYLTREANAATLRQVAALAPGSTFITTFLLPPELLDDEDRTGLEAAQRGARASGTPFVSFFAPEEMLALALESGFADARHVSAADLNARYFTGRTDGLRTSRGEELLVATTPPAPR
jgi:O-methyltransferase involved in polyketide biosynthesis